MRITFYVMFSILLLSISTAQAFAGDASISVTVVPGAINASTDAAISYTLTSIDDSTVVVYINDADGKTVRTINGDSAARTMSYPATSSGPSTVTWNGRYEDGTVVPDGTYDVIVSASNADDSLPVQYITSWGSRGSGVGQFNYPWGIAISPAGRVYLVDRNNNRVQAFDSDGNYLAQWGSFGGGSGQFYWPRGIAVNSSGYVYVVDTMYHRVQVFDASGHFLLRFGRPGYGNGQLYYPEGIAVDSGGRVYVADSGNNRVQVFDADGRYLAQWACSSPRGIAVNASGYVYVVDWNNCRVQVFDSGGNYLAQWGRCGKETNGQLYYPWGIAVDSGGRVYVADSGNNRVQVFDADGRYLAQWGSYGSGAGQFANPYGIAVNASGYVYVVDTVNHRVQVFGSRGASSTVSGRSSVVVDDTPPLITGHNNIANEEGWFNADVTINFTATDATSGVRSIAGNTTLTAEGAGQSAVGEAVDYAGNVAQATVCGINIDKTPPAITVARSSWPNAYGWYRGPVRVSFQGYDALSGVASVTGPVTFSDEGANQQVTGIATDKAGNSASTWVNDINIDLTAPTITGAATASPNANGWYDCDITVRFTAADALSGIATVTPDTILSSEGEDMSVAGSTADKAGNSASCVLSGFNLDKTAPVIRTLSVMANPVLTNTLVRASVSYAEPHADKAIWDWGDGSPADVTSLRAVGDSTIEASHVYARSGIYTVTVTIVDLAGNEGRSASSGPAIIYDPGAGFVTGGGWISSPVGAYKAGPAVTGKASAGFVSRYQKGSAIPSGNLEFQFNAANVRFKATSYDWLVINGAKAVFTGSGTINGGGSYKFMLTAVDGDLQGSGKQDAFRIRIWDERTGGTIYDSQLGGDVTANPTTAIAGGSIVIHR